MNLISVIVPCWNEEETIPIYYEHMCPVMDAIDADCELIFVDDGSQDATLSEMKKLSEKDARCQYLSFSRNFGKEAAIYAGLCKAKGDYVVVMDVDLQDPPELIPEMLDIIRQGEYDCVGTRRVDRKGEPPVRSFFARMFYKLMNHISDVEIVDGARDFRLMTRRYVNSLLEMKEYNRFSKGLFGWVGYKTKWLEYENVERTHGETKWSFWKLFLYSLDGITAFSTVPLAISSIMGVVFCIIAFVAIIALIIKNLIYHDPTPGWPSMVCIILLVSGVQLFCLGIVGQYLSKTYLEVKKRPIYLVKEEL